MKKTMIAISMAVVFVFVTAVALCVQALFTSQTVGAENSGMRVVIDAGHGGVDGGVTGVNTGVKESDLNLAIAYRLHARLTDMGFEVTMTRKTEAGLYDAATKGFKKRDMQRRKEIIEEADPDLVLSIHQNRYDTRFTRGAQVFYKKNHEGGKMLAVGLQDSLNALYEKQGSKKRTAATGDYFMLDCADCPSVIIECGFLSNPEDETLLMTDFWQERLAESIAAGVISYLTGITA